jgi:hypothetical protein
MMRRRAQLLLCVALTVSAPARAQGDAPRGQTLYDEGVAAYTEGDLATACPKFQASFEADPKAAPLFMLAKCAERQGRLATALRHYEDVIRMGGLERELLDQAAQAVSRLGPIAPKVELRRGQAPTDAVAKVDGGVVDVGLTFRVDPGEHTLLVEAPGREPWQSNFTAKQNETTTVDLQAGDVIRPKDAALPATQQQQSPALWIAGGVVGGAGVASFIVFGVTGGVILDQCGGSLSCPSRQDTGEPSAALVDANHATFWIGVGGVGVGTALLIAAAVTGGGGGEADTSVSVAPGPAPLGLGMRVGF